MSRGMSKGLGGLAAAVLFVTGCANQDVASKSGRGGPEAPPGPMRPESAGGRDGPGFRPEGAKFEAFLEEAVRASEAFRRALLGGLNGRLLARSIEYFQQHAAPFLRGRISVDGFRLEGRELLRRIAGTQNLCAANVCGPFEGEWHGRWAGVEVDHRWATTETLDPPRRFDLDGGPVWVRSQQYAWVGDGFGLNLVGTRDPDRPDRDFLLGYVVQVEDGDPERPRARRPHVGIAAGAGRIVWATASEVFLEERLLTGGGTEVYAITGFYYGVRNRVLAIRGGFQAVYTRDARNRPDFFRFPIRAEIALD